MGVGYNNQLDGHHKKVCSVSTHPNKVLSLHT